MKKMMTSTSLINDKRIYTINDCTELFDKIEMVKVKRNHVEYFNTAISFDIETSSFFDKETLSKSATMYIWQMCFSGGIIIGRRWDEFVNLLYMIHNYYETSDTNRMIIYIHNASFEFQWLRKWLTWTSVFALEERKVVKAVTNLGIEFRCSYILSNKSLQKLAEDLPDEFNGIAKLTGELDYSQIRGSNTPLSDQELQYCINDVLIVVYYIYDKLCHENNIANIPLTSTGYVRKAMRKHCLYNKDDYARSWYYKRLIRKLTMTVDDYLQYKRLFQGGFVHCSCLASGKIFKDIGSIDYISCYPGMICRKKYPISSFTEVKITKKDDFEKYLNNYCCMFDVEFKNFKSAVIFEHILSESKCEICDNAIIDNGRIVSADRIRTTVNELDYELLKLYYTWDDMKIGHFKWAYKGYLPTLFIESVLEFYEQKTLLKGVEGREKDLVLAKNCLNSTYGMMVTDPCREDTIYTEEDLWDIKDFNLHEKVKTYNESKSRFTFLFWGCWVTSYARSELLKSIYHEFKTDYLYSDTDSIKFKNVEKHLQWVEKYNNYVKKEMGYALHLHRIPIEKACPTNLKGESKFLGCFEYECKYDLFESLGSKRYMTQTDGKLSLTCSGLNSSDAGKYIAEQEKPFEFFTDNMFIPAEHTGKLTHTYIDCETDGTVSDYLDHEFKFYEKSSVHLEPQEYSLSLGFRYANYLKGVKTYYEE